MNIKQFKKIGKDVIISEFAYIRYIDICILGNHIAIDPFVSCSSKLQLGNYIHISPKVGIIGGKNSSLIMEDFTFISVGSNIICASEKFLGDGLVSPLVPDKYHDIIINKPVIIKKYGGICAGCTILPGSIISEGTIIGANSLVLKETITKPWTIYGGSPIKEIRSRKKEIIKKYGNEITIFDKSRANV